MADPLSASETIAAHQAELEPLVADADQEDDTFGRFGDRLDAHLNSLAVSVPAAAVTGYTELDSPMKLMPGQMMLVAARPAMGKSAFAFGVATANANNGALHRTGNVGAATLPLQLALAAEAHPGPGRQDPVADFRAAHVQAVHERGTVSGASGGVILINW
ncbi:DnaB-like helicase C-terminal domain-containing protein [Streptomyces luteogriseus]|uniref:DnaB-like helicase C-terminal domain-containing protein n=1 Tax=Streptomyces luteogriseus TaxID=68233 RepID=UPI00369E4ECB